MSTISKSKKKFFRIKPNGELQFSDKYDRELGFIGKGNVSKDEIVNLYIKGKITIREARHLLDRVEGERLVKIIDNRNYGRKKHRAV